MWLMGLHISLRRYSFLLLLCSLCSSDYISTNMSSSSQILLSYQIYYWVPLVKFSCQFQNLHLVSFFSSFYLFVFGGVCDCVFLYVLNTENIKIKRKKKITQNSINIFIQFFFQYLMFAELLLYSHSFILSFSLSILISPSLKILQESYF